MKKLVAGVDEVGRGSLIGPVYASAVILKKSKIRSASQLSKKAKGTRMPIPRTAPGAAYPIVVKGKIKSGNFLPERRIP